MSTQTRRISPAVRSAVVARLQLRTLTAVAPKKKLRRNKPSKLLPTPPRAGSVQFPGAKNGPSVGHLTPADRTWLLVNSPEFQATVGQLCGETWDGLSDHAKRRRAYGPWELESVEVLRRVKGFTTARKTRDWLAGDRGGRARRLLGFDDESRDHIHERPRPRQEREGEDPLRPGVPSEAAQSRHRDDLAVHNVGEEDARVRAYEKCFELLASNNLAEFEVCREDARQLFGDGAGVRTVFTGPIYEEETAAHRAGALRKCINAASVTAWDAGFVARSAGDAKYGHGWNIVNLPGAMGLPWGYRVIRRNGSEPGALIAVLESHYRRIVRPWMVGLASVLSCDGLFDSNELRGVTRSLNIVENIQGASRGEADRSVKEAKKLDETTYRIRGHEHWVVNGHRELRALCESDHQVISHRYRMENGRLRVFLEGECDCGHTDDSITVTSGRWRMNSAYTELVPCLPGETPDWSMGNPLTYNNPLSDRYLDARMVYQEGLHGLLKRTYALLEDKRWFRTTDEVRLETAMVFCIVHVVAREALRQQGLSATHAPSVPGAPAGTYAAPRAVAVATGAAGAGVGAGAGAVSCRIPANGAGIRRPGGRRDKTPA